MAVKSLSPKQECIINFIAGFLRDKGYSPTIRDIATGCGLGSTSVVTYNLSQLQQAGHIRRRSDISRNIEFLAPSREAGKLVHIPVVGVLAAGEPIPVADTGIVVPGEGVDVGEDPVRGKQDIYALRVGGGSRLDSLIGDGDMVLMGRPGGLRMAKWWRRGSGQSKRLQ